MVDWDALEKRALKKARKEVATKEKKIASKNYSARLEIARTVNEGIEKLGKGAIYTPYNAGERGVEQDYIGKANRFLVASDVHRRSGKYKESASDLDGGASQNIHIARYRGEIEEEDYVKYLGAIVQRSARLATQATKKGKGIVAQEAIKLGRSLEQEIRELKSKKKSLDTAVTAALIVAPISFILALLFASPNMTGRAIGDLAQSTGNWISGVFFILGIAGLVFYLKKR